VSDSERTTDPSTEDPFLDGLAKLEPENQLALTNILLGLALDDEQFLARAGAAGQQALDLRPFLVSPANSRCGPDNDLCWWSVLNRA
jgi:hypothetical protein